MKFRVDTTGMRFFCVKTAEPAIDFQTKRPKATRDGEPIFEVQVVALGDDGESGLLTLRLIGEQPRKLAEGTPLRVAGLVAVPWEIDGRSGITYRAEQVQPADGAPAASGGRAAAAS